MPLAGFLNFVDRVPIARANAPQIFAGHTVQGVNGIAMIAPATQKLEDRVPIVSPFHVETDSPSELVGINFAAPPLIENVLVARENGFQPQNNRTVPGLAALFEKLGSKVLRVWESMIIADQDDVCTSDCGINPGRTQDFLI